MTTIDKRLTLNRASDDLLGVCMTIEGIGGALLALASDIDGMKLMTPIQTVRLLEMLSGCCDGAVHRLGLVNDLLEAVDRQEGDDE